MSHTQVQLARGTSSQIAAYTGPIGEAVVNTEDGSLNIQDGSVAGGKFRIRAAPGGPGYTRSVPTNGGTTTTAAGERRRVFVPAATITSHTIVLPSSPQDGDLFELRTSQAITNLTPSASGGASVSGGTFLMPANTTKSWLYCAADTTWY